MGDAVQLTAWLTVSFHVKPATVCTPSVVAIFTPLNAGCISARRSVRKVVQLVPDVAAEWIGDVSHYYYYYYWHQTPLTGGHAAPTWSAGYTASKCKSLAIVIIYVYKLCTSRLYYYAADISWVTIARVSYYRVTLVHCWQHFVWEADILVNFNGSSMSFSYWTVVINTHFTGTFGLSFCDCTCLA